jgi:hypothetical protein
MIKDSPTCICGPIDKTEIPPYPIFSYLVARNAAKRRYQQRHRQAAVFRLGYTLSCLIGGFPYRYRGDIPPDIASANAHKPPRFSPGVLAQLVKRALKPN